MYKIATNQKIYIITHSRKEIEMTRHKGEKTRFFLTFHSIEIESFAKFIADNKEYVPWVG